MQFAKLQQQAKNLEEYIVSKGRSGHKDDVFVLFTHLLAECGEAADEVKGLEGRRAESPDNYSKDELAKELVDIVFNVLRIADRYSIDLDQYWNKRLEKIRAKFE